MNSPTRHWLPLLMGIMVLLGGMTVIAWYVSRQWRDTADGFVERPDAPTKPNGTTRPPSTKALDVSAEDWTQFRGPGGHGRSTATNLPTTWNETENLHWKTELPGAGASSPVILDSRIYLTCWKGFAVPGQPGGSMDDLKLILVCLNRDRGDIRWTREITPRLPEEKSIREGHGYASSTPAVDAERVYAFFGKTGVIAFDHEGEQRWHVEVGDKTHNWGSAASPILFGDLVIVNASVESESLIALDKKNGRERWRVGGIAESWNTPVLGANGNGETELIVAVLAGRRGGQLLGIDPARGEELWTCSTDIASYMVPSVVVHDGVAYCIGGRANGGLAVRLGGRGDVTKSHRLWTIRKGSNVSSPVAYSGHLYWMNDKENIAYCAELATGNIVYEERVEGMGGVYAAALLADGKLYYLDRQGRTAVLAAQPRYERLAVNTLSRRVAFNATPAVAGTRLFVRSDRFLYCLGTK